MASLAQTWLRHLSEVRSQDSPGGGGGQDGRRGAKYQFKFSACGDVIPALTKASPSPMWLLALRATVFHSFKGSHPHSPTCGVAGGPG